MKAFFKQFFSYYLQTFKNIFSNSSILTTMILSVFLYSFFYPIAYKGEKAENIPIVIVDEEKSQLSNQVISAVEKSPNVKIQAITSNFLEAKQLIREQKAQVILLLPDNLSQSIRRGESGGIGLYLSSAYFLQTKEAGVGIATSIENVLVDYAQKFTEISHFQVDLPIHQIPLFNPLSGYGSYIFPAVAPLIIHQTIFLGLCMLIASYREKKWKPKSAEFFAVFATALTIGTFGCLYLFGFTFWLNDYPRGGNFWGMIIAIPIFLSAVIGLAMFFASFLDISERAGHVIVFTSIPLFLLSGSAWPLEAMPQLMQWLSWCLPSTNGIQMFVQLNQMGVPTFVVVPKLIYLAAAAIVLLTLAYYRLVIKART
ncbi:ABC transporter permease [Acinetobacter gerneri]|uniref:ABC-2 type transporter transmembrane domain-containing protein n=1 Tax=Acinetobacter gerneri DSM 14967 = CIP 107464 = MTCC 9824 TaxID=1120926 RepID=N8ZQX8_9GAMM|nr:ABC transporter permease [Acinetobacter gerneri]ENV34143.1 hypothetical protein F960_01833 [Acinetobacter gerneri DSM 14967 = CIP 107464 = MTCC 9824]EPR83589.1 ABC-type multidrug transport system, permease component [Acinetobacter gerneri DSM 14967 = CIP 107464 = MTCC 9824]